MSGWMNKRPRDPHPARGRERERKTVREREKVRERESEREGKSDFKFRQGVWCVKNEEEEVEERGWRWIA